MSAEQADESWRGQVGRMIDEQMARFLAEGVVCRLGCLDEEGWPYVVPVWFHYADGGYYIIPRERSAWARYLQRDGRVFLSIDDPTPPLRKVLVKGTAELVEEPNVGGRWVPICREMALRYFGESGLTYFEKSLHEPRWLFFVRPEEMSTWVGGWAKRYKHSDW